MKRRRLPSEMWETFRAMSVDIARLKKFEFMRETAMMSLEKRKLVGLCMFEKDVIEDRDSNEFLDGFAIPCFVYMGRAKWGNNVVTDLGFL